MTDRAAFAGPNQPYVTVDGSHVWVEATCAVVLETGDVVDVDGTGYCAEDPGKTLRYALRPNNPESRRWAEKWKELKGGDSS